MRKTEYKKSLLFKLLLAVIVAGIFGLRFAGSTSTQAATGINEQINYQGRLLTGTGAVVPDGTYNMEFKIIQDGDGCNPTSGTPPCGGTVEWTETRTGGNMVTVKNGYFSVYLGSVTAFGTSVDWNQDTLWLSVNIGGTGAPSWDGEMEPFNRLSSTPYALNSKSLGGLLASNFVQLAQGSQIDSSTASSIYINKTGASGNILELEKNGSDVLVVGNSGGLVVTSASANALAVGAAGTTNPAFNVDASTVSSATGLNIKSAAAAGGLAITTLSSGVNEALTISAKGSGTITLASGSTGDVQFFSSSNRITSGGALTIAGALSASNFSGSSSGTNTGDQTSVTGNAGTATALQTARNINGVSFNGTADITVTAAAGTLTGATLNSGVTASSLTSVGTLTGLTVTGTANINTSGSAVTTIGAMITTDLVLQDAQWNITGLGAATFASLSAGSGLITTSGTIGTAATTSFTGLTGVFSSSVTTPLVDTSGTLSLGTGSSTATSLGKTGTTLTVNPTAWTATPTISGLITATSGLTANGTSTFNTDVNFALDGAENIDVTYGSAPTVDLISITSATGTTTTGVDGLSLTFAQAADADADTNSAFQIAASTTTTNASDIFNGINLDFTNASTAGSQRALYIRNVNDAANAVTESLLTLENAETTASTVTDAIRVVSSGVNGGIVDGLDVSDSNIDNAINIGANAIAGTNFSVNSAGAVTAVGLNSGSGLIQGTGGLTVTGTTNINATGTAATNIGNSTGALVIVSGGTSSWSNTSGNLTIQTLTTGNLVLDSVAALNLGITSSTSTSLGKTGTTLTVNPTAWTATPTISGLITATSGLTSTGTLTANGAVVLGDGGDDIAINSNDWDISSAGAASGLTTIAASGLISANGGVTLASAQALTFAGTTVATNTIKFADSSGGTVSGLNFTNATGTNFLSIRDLTVSANKRFGGLILADAFASKQSYFGEEFNVDKANDCVANTFTTNTTSNKSRGTMPTGGNFGTACTTSGNDQFTTELSTSAVATASNVNNTCTFKQPTTNINGIEQVVAASTTGAPNVDCLEYIGTSNNAQGNNLFNSSYLPQVQTKVQTGTRTATQPQYVGLSDMVAALVGPAAGNKGAYFTNCSTPIAAGTCSATNWYGVVQDGTTASVTSACPVAPSTTNFAYLRIETRPDSAGTGVITEFFIDSDTTDGIAEQSCGSITSASGSGYLNSALNMFYMATIKATSSVTNTLGMDYFRVWQDDYASIPVEEVVSGTPEGEPDYLDESPVEAFSFDGESILSDLMVQTDPDQQEVARNKHRMDLDYLVATGGIVTPTLTANQVKTNEIAGSTGSDVSINIGDDGNLLVKGTNNETVFSIDAQGNVILAGNLETNTTPVASSAVASATSDQVVFQTATVELDMAVNGSLVVGNGLQVSGPATFNGESLFDNLVRFSDAVEFNGEVSFNGSVAFNNNNGGFANIKIGETEARVTFTKPYPDTPVVTVNPRDGQFLTYAYKDLTKDGFTIVLKDPAGQDISFAWTALYIKDPKTAGTP